MAEENKILPTDDGDVKKVEEKAKKKANKKPNFIVRMFKGLFKFFKDTKGEMKKVTWMSARDVRKSTILVSVSVVVVGLATLGIDSLFSFIIKWLGSLY